MSEAAPAMTSCSVRFEFAMFLRRWAADVEVGVAVEESDCREEKRSSRSLSFARSAARLAASWALRNWVRELRNDQPSHFPFYLYYTMETI